MVAPFSIITTVTALNNYIESRVGELSPGCRRQRPSVKAGKDIGIKVMRRLGCLAYAGYKEDLMRS